MPCEFYLNKIVIKKIYCLTGHGQPSPVNVGSLKVDAGWPGRDTVEELIAVPGWRCHVMNISILRYIIL